MPRGCSSAGGTTSDSVEPRLAAIANSCSASAKRVPASRPPAQVEGDDRAEVVHLPRAPAHARDRRAGPGSAPARPAGAPPGTRPRAARCGTARPSARSRSSGRAAAGRRRAGRASGRGCATSSRIDVDQLGAADDRRRPSRRRGPRRTWSGCARTGRRRTRRGCASPASVLSSSVSAPCRRASAVSRSMSAILSTGLVGDSNTTSRVGVAASTRSRPSRSSIDSIVLPTP